MSESKLEVRVADPKKEERLSMITEQRMKLAEVERQDWVVNPEFGVTVADLMRPGYWSHMAKKMQPYDHIEARAEDGAWVAYLIVTGVDRAWARVVLDRVVKLTTADVAETQALKERHYVKWHTPQTKYAVFRESDQAIVRDGFQDAGEAKAWLREHEKTP